MTRKLIKRSVLAGVGLVIVACGVSGFAYWKVPHKYFLVGASLCGPVCVTSGPQYYERSCLGLVHTDHVPDAYFSYCIGIPYGARRCYGYPDDGVSGRPQTDLERVACPDDLD